MRISSKKTNFAPMLDIDNLIRQYYSPGTPLYDTLVIHSRQVAGLAVRLAIRYNDLHPAIDPLDINFVREAAMLHDIGICRTDAAGIHCHGTEPYICHGILGAEMLRQHGLPRHALVCERHTGAGLSLDDIISQNLPLPHRPMLPVTMEEKVICYADKFFSKTHLGEPARTLERVGQSLAKFGPATLARFQELTALFGTLPPTPF